MTIGSIYNLIGESECFSSVFHPINPFIVVIINVIWQFIDFKSGRIPIAVDTFIYKSNGKRSPIFHYFA